MNKRDEQAPPINFTHLKDHWKRSYVLRKEVSEFSEGLLSVCQMSTLDYRKQGPERFYLRNQVAYPVEQLVAWMEQRLTSRVSPSKSKKN